MSMKVFEAACNLANEFDSGIFIGGGEPTIHPKFWTMLGMAMTYSFDNKIGLITNGSQTETAIRLARLARNGIIFCGLSQDEYHDRIDPEVIAAFNDGLKPVRHSESHYDLREIRDTSNNISNVGRAKENLFGEHTYCVCNDMFVAPSGKIYACGCKEKSLGTVFEPQLDNYYFQCSRDAA